MVRSPGGPMVLGVRPIEPDLAAPSNLSALQDRRFDAVLFDLDGTLIDSTSSVRRSWMAWAKEHDVDAHLLEGNHGVPAAQIVASVLAAERRDAALARIVELEVADAAGIGVLPGAVEALAALTRGRAAIVTSCTRVLARARIGAAGLRAPQVVVTADDVVLGKPDPAPFLLAARRLGVDPARCLVVEDAPSGLVAARRAGAATLAVRTTTAAHELEADAVVRDLADVRWWVDSDRVRVGPALPVPPAGQSPPVGSGT